MTQSIIAGREGLRMYDELIAVHAILRRGSALTSAGFDRLVGGGQPDVKVLADVSRWLVEFAHHHHASEDELLWPVLRELFPEAVAELDQMTDEHQALGRELQKLAAATDAITVVGADGDAARRAVQSAYRVQHLLISHLDAEEPVLEQLFPQVPDKGVVGLRKAIADGVPRSGPHYVFGLLEDPARPAGYQALVGNFPPPARWLRPILLSQYRKRKRALGVYAVATRLVTASAWPRRTSP
jgi:hemerythrin-like domain-containing protein